MANPVNWAANRIGEWWTRTCWGWLVIIGPVLIYAVMTLSLDLVGLSPSNPVKLDAVESELVFREGESLLLHSVGGRLEYALVGTLLLMTAVFSILWSLPRVMAAIRNPFGGLTGLIVALGLSAAIYWMYWVAPYDLREIFADDILKLAEERGLLRSATLRLELFGEPLLFTTMAPAEIMSVTRDVIYFFSNAAPWCLIVLAARCASFEPRRLYDEPAESLRRRMVLVRVAVLLAAANLVLSVAYSRAMVSWPPKLLVAEVARDFDFATSRYIAVWGALGTLMLISALAPAYISLTGHYDRVATHALVQKLEREPTFRERMEWRREHGLSVSMTQALTTIAAVLAPVLTSPTLDASGYGPQGGGGRPAISASQNP